MLYLIPMKIDQVSSRQQLYWLVLEMFYGLDIMYGDMLPACFVLREFMMQFICDKYSLYFNPKCMCSLFDHLPSMACGLNTPPRLRAMQQ